VLGSTQSPAEIDDHERLVRGWELVKRRSGGGAVVVTPAAQVWLDLFVPRDDPLYEDDVARAAYFVADLWASALVSTAVSQGSVDPIRAFAPTRFSRSVCFSGLGPGEVTAGGNKVVGVSQRRDRSGAWFFTMALLQNVQGALSQLLVVDEEDRLALTSELESKIGALSVSSDVLEGAVERELVGVS
jgi:lipoate---protein ligase